MPSSQYKITITVGPVSLFAEINRTKIAMAGDEALPIESFVNIP